MDSKYPMPQTYKLIGWGTNSEGEKIQIDFGEVSDLKVETSYDSVCSCSGMLEMPWQTSKSISVSFSTPAFNLEVLTGKKEEEMAKGDFIAAIFPNRDGSYSADAKVYYYEIATLNGLIVGDKIKVLTNTRVAQHLSDVDSVSMGTAKKDPYGDSWIQVLKIFRDVNYKCMPVELEALSALGAWSKIIDYDIKKCEPIYVKYDPASVYVKKEDVMSIGDVNSEPKIVFKNGTSIEVIKEDNSMNMKKLMGDFTFGKFNDSSVKYSFNGVAFRVADGTYNVYNEDGTITNVSDMVIDIPIFAMPVAKADIKVGDIILHPTYKTPLVVKENAQTAIIAVEPNSNEVKTFAPKKSIFGFDFYTKITTPMDMFGGANADESNPFGNMLPFLMLGDGEFDMSTMFMFSMMNGANGGTMDMNAMLPFLMLNNKSDGGNNDFLMAMLMAKGFGVQKDSGSKPNEN